MQHPLTFLCRLGGALIGIACLFLSLWILWFTGEPRFYSLILIVFGAFAALVLLTLAAILERLTERGDKEE